MKMIITFSASQTKLRLNSYSGFIVISTQAVSENFFSLFKHDLHHQFNSDDYFEIYVNRYLILIVLIILSIIFIIQFCQILSK